MPRIPYAQEGHEAPGATPYYAALRDQFGLVPNVVKLVGHSAAATQGLVDLLGLYFRKLALSPRLREIAYLAAARTNGCGYCQGHHVPLARKAGLTDAQLAALGDAGTAGEVFPAAEAAAVRFSIETTAHVVASDEAVRALNEHFTPAQIAEIAFVVSSANFIQRIGRNFGAELEF